jgi:Cd2+/Zn2+-exporting ATPase
MNQQQLSLRVDGMDCADCAVKLEKGVSQLPGIAACSVSFATTRMSLAYDPGVLDLNQVVQRVRAMGYDLRSPDQPAPLTPVHLRGMPDLWRAHSREALTLTAALCIALGVVSGLAGWPEVVRNGWYALAMISGGYHVARKAINNLRFNRSLDINALMSIAAVGAAIIGEWAEGAVVILLFNIGELLESYTMDRARNAIRSLMDLAPSEATVLRPCLDCAGHLGQPLAEGGVYVGGPCPWCEPHEAHVPVAELAVDEILLVRPGERIPMDGVVHSGRSAVNQAPITGESLPVDKTVGDEVFAGTVNGSGALTVQVTRLAADNTLSRLIHMVEEAQAQKAPAQRWVDSFARVYTPAVVGVAVLIAVIPPLFLGQPFLNTATSTGWLYRALALLVIACPCALVISTPVSIVSAIAAAARHGVLIKGGAHLEAMGRLRVMAFDKTGTLTMGQPALTAVRCIDHASGAVASACDACDDVLALAAAVERRSEHPLAAAVVQGAAERNLHQRYASAEAMESIAGRGVRGRVAGQEIHISSHRYVHELAGIAEDTDLCRQIAAAENGGQTTMLVHDAGAVRGYLAVADQIRPESAAAVAALKKSGIERVVMLTGDNEAAAHAIGRQVGIDEVRAGLLPQDKVSAVQALMQHYQAIAMVGDGVNDAPAMATATVGIAMGSAGADQALETADIALMGDDLLLLPFVVRLSRATRAIVIQNIAFSLLIKAVFMLLALSGLATLWMAVFADMGASLIVTFNGMRLLRSRPSAAEEAHFTRR